MNPGGDPAPLGLGRGARDLRAAWHTLGDAFVGEQVHG
jgi:hypothetical protein